MSDGKCDKCQGDKRHYRMVAIRKAHPSGPEKDGWSMPTGGDSDGEDFYDNINYCPFCGRKLEV